MTNFTCEIFGGNHVAYSNGVFVGNSVGVMAEKCNNEGCCSCAYTLDAPLDCIMQCDPRYDVQTKDAADIFCSYCLEDIAEHLSAHHQ